jgi:arabinose-5-phosphate isomerase
MGSQSARASHLLTAFEQLRYARQILQTESRTLAQVAKRLDQEFCRAVEYLYQCRGNVIVTGMGKAGLVGQKIMATLASTGTPSHCLHPAEAVHGDLGRIHAEDVLLVLSQSGETEEIIRLLGPLAEFGVPIIAITARADSTLGRAATVTINLGLLEEACPLGLAPSSSTTAMLAVGDALALVTSRARGFGREDFARFHPAGSLGQKLSKVENHMRPLAECRVAPQDETVRQVLIRVGVPGRRTGATMLVDGRGRLAGIFTDSDLARLFERHRDADLDAPIRDVMTRNPLKTTAGSMMIDAVAVLAQRKISELPVVDAGGRPVGLIDITDVVGLLPAPTVAGHPLNPPGRASGPRRRLPARGSRARSLAEKQGAAKRPRCRVFPAHESSP